MLDQSQITIDNARLQSLQTRFAFTTLSVPFLGFIVAVITLFYSRVTITDLSLLVSMYFLTFIGVTVGFHRYFAHKAFKTKPVIRIILAILGSMAAFGPISNWVATHRRHHRYTDQPGDPHSPYFYEEKKLNKLYGLWHSHIGWMMNSKMTNSILFAGDLIRDPIIGKINKLYLLWVILGLIIPAVIDGVITLSWIGLLKGLLWGGLVRLFFVHNSMSYISSFGHLWGSNDFISPDESRNNHAIALLTFGESLHNNHHAFPSSAIFGLKWWQLDVGGWVIRILELVNLVWDVKFPSQVAIKAKKTKAGIKQN
jgi:stearoyl-CoA desaturase (Delta-9 desaturase)